MRLQIIFFTLKIKNSRFTPETTLHLKPHSERLASNNKLLKSSKKHVLTYKSLLTVLRQKATKARQAQSRIKQLERMQQLHQPM